MREELYGKKLGEGGAPDDEEPFVGQGILLLHGGEDNQEGKELSKDKGEQVARVMLGVGGDTGEGEKEVQGKEGKNQQRPDVRAVVQRAFPIGRDLGRRSWCFLCCCVCWRCVGHNTSVVVRKRADAACLLIYNVQGDGGNIKLNCTQGVVSIWLTTKEHPGKWSALEEKCRIALTLGELETLAGSGLSGLFTFLHSGVTSKETMFAKGCAEIFIILYEGAGDSEADGAYLSVKSASGANDLHIELVGGVRYVEGLQSQVLLRKGRNILLEQTAVDGDASGAFGQPNMGYCGLAATGRAVCCFAHIKRD